VGGVVAGTNTGTGAGAGMAGSGAGEKAGDAWDGGVGWRARIHRASAGMLPPGSAAGVRADGVRADGALADGVRADGALADGVRADGALADGVRADEAFADGDAARRAADAAGLAERPGGGAVGDVPADDVPDGDGPEGDGPEGDVRDGDAPAAEAAAGEAGAGDGVEWVPLCQVRLRISWVGFSLVCSCWGEALVSRSSSCRAVGRCCGSLFRADSTSGRSESGTLTMSASPYMIW